MIRASDTPSESKMLNDLEEGEQKIDVEEDGNSEDLEAAELEMMHEEMEGEEEEIVDEEELIEAEIDVERDDSEELEGSDTSSSITPQSPHTSSIRSSSHSSQSPNTISSGDSPQSVPQRHADYKHHNTHPANLHEKRHLCEICGKGFPYLSILESHKRCHTGEKPFSCHFCDKRFAQKATLQVHERTHTGERPYQCRYCNKKFAQYGTKTVHEKSAHLGMKLFYLQCQFCPKTFTLKNYLKLHVKQVHEQAERKHICKYCSKSFAYAGSLQVHIRTHTGERPYQCRFCVKAFASQGNLQSHERTHTGDRPYTCKTCNRTFIQKSQLTAHEATHLLEGGEEQQAVTPTNLLQGGTLLPNSDSPVMTIKSPDAVIQSAKLPMPMAMPLSTEQLSVVGQQSQQQTQSQYICKFCGKRYAYASSLYVHTRNHTNERPFKCRYCDKTFTNQGNMMVHHRVHTGEKPFSCPTCGKSYAQKVGLKIHLEQCGNATNNLSVPITSISSTRQSSESPINVDTDSDASYGALSRRNSIAIPNDAFKSIPQRIDGVNLYGATGIDNPYAKLQSLTAPVTSGTNSQFTFPANLLGNQNQISSVDFGPKPASKPPLHLEISMPEAGSAFHAPVSKPSLLSGVSLGGDLSVQTPLSAPALSLNGLPPLSIATSAPSLLDPQLLAIKGLLELSQGLPPPGSAAPFLPNLSSSLLTTQLLLQHLQNPADSLSGLSGLLQLQSTQTPVTAVSLPPLPQSASVLGSSSTASTPLSAPPLSAALISSFFPLLAQQPIDMKTA
ncbi:hypothetical protein WR25_18834 [Diploscapter pachys]|uniref:C2H2-type domain-containing protein n=1 Tax=Diploscapter pachys TaxID=2018661 RepID=A0A2A2KIH2_9BILA|nr:hypothetical protein WR25_18834 [Diploscapter pachys]